MPNTSLHDPLTLPCGLVLPNRIMQAAMSEALTESANSPGARRATTVALLRRNGANAFRPRRGTR